MPAFGIIFTAFCIWLGIRTFNRRERWAMRTAVVVVYLLALYVLSSGPTRMLAVHARIGTEALPGAPPHFVQRLVALEVDNWWAVAYSPLCWLSKRPPGVVLEVYWQHFPVQATFQ